MAFIGNFTRVGIVNNFAASSGLAYDNTNNILYDVENAGDTLGVIDVQTGARTQYGSGIFYQGRSINRPSALEFDNNNNILYLIDNSRLFTINIPPSISSSPSLSIIGSSSSFGVGENQPASITFDTNNNIMYMVGHRTDVLYSLSLSNGRATQVGNTPAGYGLGLNINAIQYDPNSDTLYGSSGNRLYTINTNTGAATIIPNDSPQNIDTFNSLLSLTLDPDNNILYTVARERYEFRPRDFRTRGILYREVGVVPVPSYTAPSSQSVNEGGNYSLDLSTVFSGATSYSLRSGNEAYVSISGSVVSFTAPQVTTDTTINLLVRATNSAGNNDQSIPVLIRDVPAPVVPVPVYTPPTQNPNINSGRSWSFDLSTVFSGATTYGFQPGYTRPTYLTLTGSRLSISTAPTVSVSTTISILVQATNMGGTTPGTLNLVILPMAAPPPVTDTGLDVRLSIADTPMDKHIIASLRDINFSADFPEVGNFRLGQLTFNLFDVDGSYNPRNASNFFVQNGFAQSGIDVPVSLDIISDGVTSNVFTGMISSAVILPVSGDIECFCEDLSARIGKDNVEDFGITRRFKLFQETEAFREKALGEGTPRADGIYPVLDTLLPSSDDSGLLYATSLSDTHDEAENLRISGNLEPTNYIISDNAVETEGGPLELTQQQALTFPQIRFKSPFRWRHLNKLIEDLLDHYNITQRDINLPVPDIGEHLSTNGRPGYDLLTTDQFDLPDRWRGFVTKIIYRASDTSYYFLYTINNSDMVHRSRLIKYNITTYEWSVVYNFALGDKPYNMALSGSLLYFMLTRETGPSHPDPFNNPPDMAITVLNLSTNAYSVIANNGTSLRPYTNSYYHVNVGEYGLVPDSRKSFLVHNRALYYPYVASNGRFGVACTASGTLSGFTKPIDVCEFQYDGLQNFANCSFGIRNNLLYAAATWRNGNDSEKRIYSVNISSIPIPS